MTQHTQDLLAESDRTMQRVTDGLNELHRLRKELEKQSKMFDAMIEHMKSVSESYEQILKK